ncbi:MAG: hypothetical protein HC814_06520 [Rhodobacteraceae bacterium]|nr:hypothetical protein [Paracoccaceae bacterium]
MSSKRDRRQLAQRIRHARRHTAGKETRKKAGNPCIGYCAHDGVVALCDGDACIVAGSRDEMQRIRDRRGLETMTIQPARFRQILSALQLGAAYCFDEQAYGRFKQPGQEAGLELSGEDFSVRGPWGMHFVRVHLFG